MARIRLVEGLPQHAGGESKFRSKRIISVLALPALLALFVFFNPLPYHITPRDAAQGVLAVHSESSSTWPTWEGIEHMVVFGDSLTSTHFKWRQEQPSEANPIGNPAFPGNTSAVGPNWVSYVTGTYNATLIKTLNLAVGGATVNGEIIPQMLDSVKSFKNQVEEFWLSHYVPSTSRFNWKGDDTLFVSFFGSNDVTRAYLQSWESALASDIREYMNLLETLYRNGGRQFLVLNVLPFDRAPMLEREGASARQKLGELVEGYNEDLGQAVSQFKGNHPDAIVFLFDTWALFNQLLDNPCDMAETCPLQEVTTYCRAYLDERQDAFRKDPSCPYPMDRYFWLNTLHPSFRVHDAMAKSIVAYLRSFD